MKKMHSKALLFVAAVALALGAFPLLAFAAPDSEAESADLVAASANFEAVGADMSAQDDAGVVEMYRLYNPNSYEHFYTGNPTERDNLIGFGWRYEGVGWEAPASGEPVYRLYNPNNGGDHHYTRDAGERDMLIAAGWLYEEVGWYSAPEGDENSVPVNREYNPNEIARNHNYTASTREHERLIYIGWNGEGVGWYGVQTAEAHAAFAGKWNLKSFTSTNGRSMTAEEITLVREYGYQMYMDLNDNGTSYLLIQGDEDDLEENGTWKAITAYKANMSFDGYSSDDMYIESGDLVIAEDDVVMNFTRA